MLPCSTPPLHSYRRLASVVPFRLGCFLVRCFLLLSGEERGGRSSDLQLYPAVARSGCGSMLLTTAPGKPSLGKLLPRVSRNEEAINGLE